MPDRRLNDVVVAFSKSKNSLEMQKEEGALKLSVGVYNKASILRLPNTRYIYL